MDKALTLSIKGLKCDAPGCGYIDMDINVEDYKNYIGARCPKCGAVLLTQEDYDAVQFLIGVTNMVNEVIPNPDPNEQLSTMKVEMDGSRKLELGPIIPIDKSQLN